MPFRYDATFIADYDDSEVICISLTWLSSKVIKRSKLKVYPRRLSVFHFANANFWSSLKRPRRRPHPNPQFLGDLPNAESLCTKLGHSITIEDSLGPVWG